MTKKAESKNLVADFLVRSSSRQAMKSMEALAILEYPIKDRHSFECALESCDDDASRSLLGTSFGASDFPLLSVESGLEKFIDRFQPFPFPVPLAPLPPIDLPDFRATPSACEVYFRDFPRDAAECGCRTYGQALREGRAL